jgi:uncharacterized membrane protein (DUF441 family)
MTWSDRTIAIALAAAGAAVFLVAGLGLLTDYDYYGRLAQALLHAQWWVSEAPPWLNELVSCGPERWCVVYPPLPAILAMPLAAVLPAALAQVLVSRIAGGVSAGILYLALRAFGAPRPIAIAGALLSTFGTTLFFSSVDGRAWYAAHAVAMPFLSAALLFAARGERAWIVGACIGLAALARLPVAAAAPAIALLLARRAGISYPRALGGVVLGGVPFALAYVGYDLLRWGSVFDSGYAQLTRGDVFFTRGLFSPFYLPRHVQAIFLEPPEIVDGTPFFLRPRGIGTSLFIVTPALLWIFASLRVLRRDVGVAAVALAALLALLPDIFHGTVGFQQFGYRFSIDAQPFLVALALVGDARRGGLWRSRPSWPFVAAVILSIVINIYATVAITRFDYWS